MEMLTRRSMATTTQTTSTDTTNPTKISVCVGSQNPCKTNAVRLAFERAFPDREIDVVGVSAESGIIFAQLLLVFIC